MARILALLLLASVAAAQGQRVGVRLRERRTASARPRITFPQVRLELQAARPPGLEGIPELSEAGRYAHVELGAGGFHIALDSEGGALALGLLHTGIGKPAIGHARADGQGGLLVDFIDVKASRIHVDVRLKYRGLEVADAALQPSRHRHGRAAIGAVVRDVILIDADGDGRYNGADDRWIAMRPERAKETPTLRRPDAMRLAEPQIPFLANGRALMVSDVAADGSSLVLHLDRPEMEMADVLQRRYAEVRETHFRLFARERTAFMTRNDLDGKRARANTPARWLDVPLSEAKRVALEKGRPLLVHFFTESNPWCFRYDFYTFPDRDVDALLQRFVLARIDAEKDAERSYAKSGARSMPALVPFTAEGEPVTFRVRSRDEKSGRVADLREKERMINGWQRPQELQRNLERILKAAGAD
ncbi:MAG: thioredoxin family protein [Planctomycetota bacterium]|jgi:hypothetical protein